jgi:Leucine-rich repeat (LRR) protein
MIRVTLLGLTLGHLGFFAHADIPALTHSPVERVEQIGGKIFLKKEKVSEIILIDKDVPSGFFSQLGDLSELTDLSLENCRIQADDVISISNIPKLEWLNLYRTPLGELGVNLLSKSKSIALLPIGKAGVTDLGLEYLCKMGQLTYLGLRGNPVTDKGARHLSKLSKLEGLYLGETKVTDRTIAKIAHLSRLQKLWLHDLPITDEAVSHLTKLTELKEVHIYATNISAQGAKTLQKSLPRCRVIHEIFPK